MTHDDRAARMKVGRFAIGDVDASFKKGERSASFVVFITNGRIQMLEGYSYSDVWPSRISEFSLFYWQPEREKILTELDLWEDKQ
jgi:hypothetical protein